MTAIHFALSPDTEALRDALLAVPIGETVTFAQLSAVIGRDAEKAARGNLNSARHIAERDHNAVFVSVRGVGLRRLPAEDAATVGAEARKGIRRGAKRAVRRMTSATAGANGLSRETQVAVAREAAALGLIAHIAETRATEAMTDDVKAPTPARAADAFLAHIGAKRETDA